MIVAVACECNTKQVRIRGCRPRTRTCHAISLGRSLVEVHHDHSRDDAQDHGAQHEDDGRNPLEE